MKVSMEKKTAEKTAEKPPLMPAAARRTSPKADKCWESIALAAYFKAEARGFEPGGELDDWLAAEAEFEAAQGKLP